MNYILFFGLQSTFFLSVYNLHFYFSIYNPHFSFRSTTYIFIFRSTIHILLFNLQSTFIFFTLQSTFFFSVYNLHFYFSVYNPHSFFRSTIYIFIFRSTTYIFIFQSSIHILLFGLQTTFFKSRLINREGIQPQDSRGVFNSLVYWGSASFFRRLVYSPSFSTHHCLAWSEKILRTNPDNYKAAYGVWRTFHYSIFMKYSTVNFKKLFTIF